jgi:hypothetical protein
MIMSVRNVRLSNNNFIDNIYDIYVSLNVNSIFSDKGYESNGFKIWKFEDTYYILNKSNGILISWWKLLGWNVECNTTLRDNDWESFCDRLRNDLEINGIIVAQMEL